MLYTYAYDSETGNIASLSMNSDNVTAFVEPDYDSFGRMTNKAIGMLLLDNASMRQSFPSPIRAQRK